jgi:hypothetical protein
MKKLIASLAAAGFVLAGCATVDSDVAGSNATYVPKRGDSSQYMTGSRIPQSDSGAKLLVPDDADRMQMNRPTQINPQGH